MATKKILIEAEIEENWVDDFCSMLKHMEFFGNIGHSGWISLYSDGDGNFRPKFKFNIDFNKRTPHKADYTYVNDDNPCNYPITFTQFDADATNGEEEQ